MACSTSSPGGGSTAGQELIDNEGIDGIVFTGSMEVGMKLLRDNGARRIPRPVVSEMGGKNPALVMQSADLDKASDGVWRSAFGAQGQKCSACSRVYVHKSVRDEFVRLLVEKTKKIKIGNPLEKDVWLGPVINEGAVKTFEDAVARAVKDGGRVLVGGKRITAGAVQSRLLRRAHRDRRRPGGSPGVPGGVLRPDHRGGRRPLAR